ncbi:MAG: hypothetical protein FWD61_18855 [Phycisphaerales bacterium]|nr:hypothetical protein [Phycisphaerales bacterium]
MKYEIIHTGEFAAKARKVRLTLEDLRGIENEIVADPEGWPVMAGTGGLRKMRFSPSRMSTGKSGGIRVCYFVVEGLGHLWLVTLFAKNEKDNLSPAERNAIGKFIAVIKKRARNFHTER